MILIRKFQQVAEERLKEKNPLIQILIGPRQVGKTTAAKAIYDNWQGPKLMVSADGPVPPTAEWLGWNWKRAMSLGQGTLLIIDEVQKVSGWAEQVKFLFDPIRGKGDLKVLLLGSSSLYLRKGMGESLAGRFELIEVPHWSFKEFSTCFNCGFEDYLKFGSYPGAFPFSSDPERWRHYILEGIVEPVLSRDIIGQSQISNPALFRQTFELAVHYPAQVVSFQKLLGQLQERGNASTIKNYLELLEKAFLIRLLPKFSGSKIREKGSSPKIVVMNQSLTNAYQPLNRLVDDSIWYGFVFESLMGAHICQNFEAKIYYWRKGNFEVDYVIEKGPDIVAVEIKSGRKKNGAGLSAFNREYPSARCEMWNRDECLGKLRQGF